MTTPSNRPRRSTRAPVETPPMKRRTETAPRKRRIRPSFIIVPAALVFIVGLFLVAYQPVMNFLIAPKALTETVDRSLTVSAANIQDNVAAMQAQEPPQYFEPDSVETLTTVPYKPDIDKSRVIGAIYAPTVNLRMAITYGVSQDLLLWSAGTLKPDQQMGRGNFAIIGHNSQNPDALFAPTHRLEDGDLVYVTDKTDIYVYSVTDIGTVDPSEVDVVYDVPGEALLTMVSCTDDGTQRVVVRALLEDTVPYSEADTSLLTAFGDL